MEISIQKPCHENWYAMTPNEQGAFCGKCVKTVIDFTNKSIDDIKDFFTQKSKEKVCGRFKTQQLTSLSFDAFYDEFKGFQFTKRFAVIIYFTFGMWLFNSTSVSAQNQEPIKGEVKIEQNTIMGGVKVNPDKSDTVDNTGPKKHHDKIVKGKVKVEKLQPVQEFKMGEIEAKPIKKEIQKPQKAMPKKE